MRKPFYTICAGILVERTWNRGYLFYASDNFLFAGMVVIILDCYTYEQEIMGERKKRKSRLSGIYFLWSGRMCLYFIGDLAGELC